MELLFTIFLMLAGQPQPVVMDYMDLGQVTAEECRVRGQATATVLMGLHPMCQGRQCYALLRCRGDEGRAAVRAAPDEAGDPI